MAVRFGPCHDMGGALLKGPMPRTREPKGEKVSLEAEADGLTKHREKKIFEKALRDSREREQGCWPLIRELRNVGKGILAVLAEGKTGKSLIMKRRTCQSSSKLAGKYQKQTTGKTRKRTSHKR